jgi:eukaryotic-like serine/threonine-protein kinase
VIEPLGSGGFGEVYRARHSVLGQEVALKIVPFAGPSDSERLARLLREARAAAAVDSPHVVRVLDAGIADGRPFLVMELVQGRTLEELAREGPMVPGRAVELCSQILAGLQAAHARAIVHRDMKPANVLISSIPGADGRQHDFVKILDFGIGKIRSVSLGAATMPGAVLGTPGYMAPEQYGKADEADHRADLYAVAAILFELLAGRLPFEGLNPDILAGRVTTERAPPLSLVAPSVPRDLAEVVDRGLARDPDARWQNAEAFARALSGALRGARTQALAETRPQGPVDTATTMPSGPPRFSKPTVVPTTMRSRRMRMMVRIALVLGLAAGFGSGAMIVYLAMRNDMPSPPPGPPTPAPTRFVETAAPPDAALPDAADDAAPAPMPDATPATATAKKGKRTRLGSVRQVGSLEEKAVDAVAARALAAIAKQCTPEHGTQTVELRVHIHPVGKVTLSSGTGGDQATCAAAAFRSAVPDAWNPGTDASGIIIAEFILVGRD